MSQPPEQRLNHATPAKIWARFTPVERTCLQTCFYRYKGSALIKDASGQADYEDPPAEAIVRAVLPEGAQQELLSSQPGAWMLNMMAVRTAAIDALLREAVQELAAMGPQVVLLGAGMDTRAWRMGLQGQRLPWFEVDSSSVLGLKQQLLQEQQPRHSRRAVVADVTDGGQLVLQLLQAGHQRQAPTIWLLEGLVGYITAQQQQDLAQQLHQLSSPGSRVVLTAPPDEAARQECLSMGVTLHHVNFDSAHAVAGRFGAEGWVLQRLLTRHQLLERYGIRQHLEIMLMARH